MAEQARAGTASPVFNSPLLPSYLRCLERRDAAPSLCSHLTSIKCSCSQWNWKRGFGSGPVTWG